jgi:nicotinate-nucleotide adenylyltransferase
MGPARRRPLTEADDADDAVSPPATVEPGSVGILGGTFDPIHHGHLAIAEEARDSLGLERVLFVPAATPPHKLGLVITPAEHRLAMVEAAIAGNPAFGCTRVEIDRAGPSYTVDTLEHVHASYDADHMWFILSSEALAGFEAWRDPERILELARLAVVPRGGPDGRAEVDEIWVRERFPGRDDRVRFLSGPLLPISGSVVRRRVAAGRSVRYLVPDAVARYIAQHRLYLEPV